MRFICVHKNHTHTHSHTDVYPHSRLAVKYKSNERTRRGEKTCGVEGAERQKARAGAIKMLCGSIYAHATAADTDTHTRNTHAHTIEKHVTKSSRRRARAAAQKKCAVHICERLRVMRAHTNEYYIGFCARLFIHTASGTSGPRTDTTPPHAHAKKKQQKNPNTPRHTPFTPQTQRRGAVDVVVSVDRSRMCVHGGKTTTDPPAAARKAKKTTRVTAHTIRGHQTQRPTHRTHKCPARAFVRLREGKCAAVR